MSRSTFLPILLLALALPTSANELAASDLTDDPKAREIMVMVDERDDGDMMTQKLEMVLIDKNGNERVRQLSSYGRDVGEDEQRIIFFMSPADVKDTGFLTYDYDESERDDDQWLYLPALRKTKRIASSDKSGSFMGSDFSFADMTDFDLDKYAFKMLDDGEVRGEKVWKIERTPLTREEIVERGYTKSVLFVRQDNYVVVRAVHWVKKGNKLKYLDIQKLEQIDGIWTPIEQTMTTKKGKKTLHKTILRFDDTKYNQELEESIFTQRRLEKGV